ncbi:MAG: GNAT family N-acetyltransferase [Acidobacteriota bacterium]
MNTILETERLLLQNWSDGDCDALFEILQDAKVVRHIDDGKPFNLEKTRKFLDSMKKGERGNGFCRWKVVEKSSGEIVGTCGFGRIAETNEIELGYLFRQKSWGKGYATEIAEAATVYGFNKLGFREIIALTNLENAASQKVLEKIGFAKRGIEIYKGEENLVYLAQNI